MTIEELELIEREETVAFSLSEMGRIAAKGTEAAVDAALARIAPFRDETAVLLRKRQGLPDPAEAIVVREVSASVPSLAAQRANYVTWFAARGAYYTPTDEQLDKMFAACSEGDEVIPDFAYSFSVRRPNGLVVSVDRKGRVGPPSPYSPAVRPAKS
jgi:hypothetical protein